MRPSITFLTVTIGLFSCISAAYSQTCNNWLHTDNSFESVTVGDVDISGDKITVEALINRTQSWTGGYNYAGDIVSKHDLPNNVNYLLRPNNAEITTVNGYYTTPPVCAIELDKTYHVAMVYDGSTLKFYRNGFLMSQVAAEGNLINNDFLTTIGDYAYPNPVGTNFTGYINEVRIWNVARTQNEIKGNMAGPLYSPSSIPGLVAYYTFDNLLNKQGTTAWNGQLNTTAAINQTNPSCNFIADSCGRVQEVIVNDYTPVVSFDVCTNSIVVEDASAFRIGDTVMIIQMSGADVDLSNSGSFGSITDYNNSGNYEINFVKAIQGTRIDLLNTVTKEYDLPDGKVQLIRVPYFTSYEVSATVTCPPWNGRTGGVLVLNVKDTLKFSGDINVGGKGFRGGRGRNSNTSVLYCDRDNYSYPESDMSVALKGEGISIMPVANSGGKGNFANGGGGGAGHNSGGGGGSNGGAGGFGGYQLNNCNSPTLDNRGIGGRALLSTDEKVFMGGGGGAGHADSYGTFTPDGGEGGGIAFIFSRVVVGNNKRVLANGNESVRCNYTGTSTCHDASGGGGGGGSIILDVGSYLGNLGLQADGGKGADMVGSVPLGGRIGGGGGGGGGQIYTTAPGYPANLDLSVAGGLNGVLTQDANNAFGSVPGSAGTQNVNATVVWDTEQFFKNIDSVRINATRTSCNDFSFSATGFTRAEPVTTWSWNFGNGNTGTAPTSNQTYGAGEFDVRLYGEDSNGCADSALVRIDVTPAEVNAGPDQEFCSAASIVAQLNATGNGPITWTSSPALSSTVIANPTATVASTTTFYAHSTLAVSCVATDSVKVIVVPDYHISETRSSCPGQLPFNWNGFTITGGGTYVANLTTSSGCDSVITLQLSVTDTLRSITSRSICNEQAPFSWNGMLLSSSGTYSAALTTVSGCDSLATLDLEVTSSLSSSVTSSVCNSAFPYSWNGVTISSPGNYTATLQSAAGCDSVVTVTVSTLATQPVQTNSTENVCAGASLILSSSAGYSAYHWSPGIFVSDSTAQNPSYQGTSAVQEMIVEAIDVNGCVTSDTAVVTMRPNPLVRTFADSSICHQQQIMLTATGANVYHWSPSNQLDNANSPNPEFSAGSSQTIYVTGTDNFGCIGRDTLNLEVRKAENLVAPSGSSLCENASTTLHGANGNEYLYLWSPSASLNSASLENPLASPAATTIYSVRITDTVCDFHKDFPVQVVVKPLPAVAIIKSNDLNCAQRSALLTATGAASYNWQPHPSLNTTTGVSVTASPSTATIYTVTGTDISGCKNSDTVKVNVLKGMEIYNIPNAFTPNGDGLNDCFGIKHWGNAKNVTFRIYNRWGELVFETSDVNECWNGKFKGQSADAGNYVFIALANSDCGKLEKKGNVILIR